jgi:hypothetical protein
MRDKVVGLVSERRDSPTVVGADVRPEQVVRHRCRALDPTSDIIPPLITLEVVALLKARGDRFGQLCFSASRGEVEPTFEKALD